MLLKSCDENVRIILKQIGSAIPSQSSSSPSRVRTVHLGRVMSGLLTVDSHSQGPAVAEGDNTISTAFGNDDDGVLLRVGGCRSYENFRVS